MTVSPTRVGAENHCCRRRNQQVRYYRAEKATRDAGDVAAARATLALHVLDRETGLCVACLTTGPCGPANNAVNLLVALGLPVCLPIAQRKSWRGQVGSVAAAALVHPLGRPRWWAISAAQF